MRILAFILVCFAIASHPASAEDQRRVELVQRWQRIVGPDVDLSKDNPLFNAISWIGPRPSEEMDLFEGMSLDDRVQSISQGWLNEFLNDSAVPDLSEIGPRFFYISDSEAPSLLMYEWERERYRFVMYESGNAILLKIIPLTQDDTEPAAVNTAAVLFDTLKLHLEDERDVRRAFLLDQDDRTGEAFYAQDWVEPGANGEWRDQVLGVRSDGATFVICYKTSADIAAAVVEYSPHWLDGAIHEERSATSDGGDARSGDQDDSAARTQPAHSAPKEGEES